MFHEEENRKSRGIGLDVEHAFSGENPLDEDSVDSTYESCFSPDLDAVGVAHFMKSKVSLNHFRIDPCPLLAWSGCAGGIPDDFLESLINSEVENFSVFKTSQTSWSMQAIPFKNGAFGGAKPS